MQTPSSERVDQILASLDKAQRVPAPPFFYTRLQARLSQSRPEEQSLLWLRPAPLVGLLSILLVLNFWLINTPTNSTSASATLADTAPEDEFQALSFEDRSVEHTVFDYEVGIEMIQK